MSARQTDFSESEKGPLQSNPYETARLEGKLDLQIHLIGATQPLLPGKRHAFKRGEKTDLAYEVKPIFECDCSSM
jgi:hypothetical protein